MEHNFAQKPKKRYSKGLILLVCLLLVITIVLGGALGFVTFSYMNYKNNMERQIEVLGNVEMDENGQMEINENGIINQAIARNEVVGIETLKGYAAQYGVSIEFLQRFFNDTIVYRDGGNVVYEPINYDLPQHSYDFAKNLVRSEAGLEYQQDGKNIAIKGIDVSKHQGNIDWKKVKADGVEFAFLRVGVRGYGDEGKLMVDDTFHQNAKAAINAGVQIGVYLYSQAISVEEAKEEAALVIEQIKDYNITYPVVFDWEEVGTAPARTDDVPRDTLTEITKVFCSDIKSAGYHPMIYGNIKWFMKRVDISQLTEYDKWFAQYFNTPFFPYDFQIWQYTASGSVDGITGNVDINMALVPYPKASGTVSSDTASSK